MDDLYQEHILDHYKHPRNYGVLAQCRYRASGANASCGDGVVLYLQLKDDLTPQAFRFTGNGCALSMASASMLTEKVLNDRLSVNQILALSFDDLVQMLGIEVSLARKKCVMLPLVVLQKMVKGG